MLGKCDFHQVKKATGGVSAKIPSRSRVAGTGNER